MQKINLQTPEITNESIIKMRELFPEVITEKEDENGKLVQGIDFELLKQKLSKNIVDGSDERYRLDWPGKRRSILKANMSIDKTLMPDKESSVDFDNTQNVYIIGDNLEVLKIIQESYLGKIKMIYIDPPYNTGKDFVYRDNYKITKEDYEKEIELEDEEGGRLFKNTDTNGRFHSDWLSMMYERLMVARDLLKEDGVIFISIDDNEVANLRKICDEIFGEANFIAQIVVEGTPKNDPYVISTAHEYCLVYVKDLEKAKTANYGISNPLYKKIVDIFEKGDGNYKKIENDLNVFYKKEKVSNENIANYKHADKGGVYRTGPIDDPQSSGSREERMNPKTGNPCKIPNGGWRCSIETWNEWIENDLICFPDNDDVIPDKKTYITSDRIDVMSALFKVQTRKDTVFLKELFETDITPFSNPKPQSLLKEFIKNTNDKNSLYLDFFAGSGSFGQAVIESNLEDEGNRKFILVQLPEEIIESGSGKDKKIARAAIDFLNSINKPTNIAELSMERIRRAGRKILEENAEKLAGRESPLDIGFRTYKVTDTIFNETLMHPDDLKQESLLDLANNIKVEKTPDEILIAVILSLGLSLDLSIEPESIGENTVFNVADNAMMACFDKEINMDVVEFIAKKKPLRAVFCDLSFKNDQDRINVESIFKQFSPETRVNVI